MYTSDINEPKYIESPLGDIYDFRGRRIISLTQDEYENLVLKKDQYLTNNKGVKIC